MNPKLKDLSSCLAIRDSYLMIWKHQFFHRDLNAAIAADNFDSYVVYFKCSLKNIYDIWNFNADQPKKSYEYIYQQLCSV